MRKQKHRYKKQEKADDTEQVKNMTQRHGFLQKVIFWNTYGQIKISTGRISMAVKITAIRKRAVV